MHTTPSAPISRSHLPVIAALALCALLVLPCAATGAAQAKAVQSDRPAAGTNAGKQASPPDAKAEDSQPDATQPSKAPEDDNQAADKQAAGKQAAEQPASAKNAKNSTKAASAKTASEKKQASSTKEVLDAFNAGSFPEALESSVEGVGCPAPLPGEPAFLCLTGYKTARLNGHSPELLQLYGNWQEVLARHNPKKVFDTKSNKLMTAPVLNQWKNISGTIRSLPAPQQLRYVNGFINGWPSVADAANYGQNEYWASPEEFFKNGGDCEDFAIAKYLALRHFGWKGDDLWIILLRDKKRSENHAVLAARTQDRIFVLDNLSRPAYLLIPIDDYLKTVTPFFAVSESGLLAFFQTSRTSSMITKKASKTTAKRTAAGSSTPK